MQSGLHESISQNVAAFPLRRILQSGVIDVDANAPDAIVWGCLCQNMAFSG